MKIDVTNLTFSYGDHTVLHGISMTAESGEITCLLGPNGSGKSTLIKCINALQSPSQGEVRLKGDTVTDLSRLEIARRIGYVPQSSHLVFPVPVYEVVMMGRRPHTTWMSGRKDMDVVMNSLSLMDLEELAMRPFSQLSGGQQQRVMMARALAQQPECLLLDEPTSALDIAHQLELMETISKQAKTRGISVLMVVHDLNLAARYADAMVLMKSGRILAEGKPENVLTELMLKEGFGVRAVVGETEDRITVIPVSSR